MLQAKLSSELTNELTERTKLVGERHDYFDLHFYMPVAEWTNETASKGPGDEVLVMLGIDPLGPSIVFATEFLDEKTGALSEALDKTHSQYGSKMVALKLCAAGDFDHVRSFVTYGGMSGISSAASRGWRWEFHGREHDFAHIIAAQLNETDAWGVA